MEIEDLSLLWEELKAKVPASRGKTKAAPTGRARARPPMGPSQRRGAEKADYSRAQTLFWKNPTQLAAEVLDGQVPAKCTIPVKDAESYYQQKLTKPERLSLIELEEPKWRGERSAFIDLLRPIAPDEVINHLKKIKASSSPGLD